MPATIVGHDAKEELDLWQSSRVRPRTRTVNCAVQGVPYMALMVSTVKADALYISSKVMIQASEKRYRKTVRCIAISNANLHPNR